MFPCHGPVVVPVVLGLILCGVSWLYWLRQIGVDVNKTLPEDQRVQWGLTEKVPAGKMQSLWKEHEKRFPTSRKRMYAAFSIVLFFLIPTTALLACVLFGQ